ncbi:MAG: ribonuclease III [Deltaproteobacteria bacterium]|nr:ribonuclease III [Deltaproteobacteria bacterium]
MSRQSRNERQVKRSLEDRELGVLQKKLNYGFEDTALLRRALTHKSYYNEYPQETDGHNERLEFLGDAVLDFVISERLMDINPDLAEGNLSKLRASIVSETGLAEVARSVELGSFLLIGRGEELSGGREKDSILSDALEAILAAVYLDSRRDNRGGTVEVEKVIDTLFGRFISPPPGEPRLNDFKTELQEYAQRNFKCMVSYSIIEEKGPDHDKKFGSAVFLRGRELGRGHGRSKKTAEQAAAEQALKLLESEEGSRQ